ncbi:MAG: response regulator [Alphaproteobacteria bacterium]
MIRIIHIDDDDIICKVTRAFLQKDGGFDVQSYNSVEDALRGVGDFAPDVILVDFMMPDMEGMLSLLNFKADIRLKDIPVVFVTGLEEDKVRASLGDNINGYLKKPYKPDTLIDAIRSVCASE